MGTNKKTVSISIVTYNDAKKADQLLNSLYTHENAENFDIYIIDNASTDHIVTDLSAKYPNVHFITNSENIGFGAGHNKALPLLSSDFHLILNPDILFENACITELCTYLEQNPDVALVTPRILNVNGTEQHLPKRLPRLRYLLAGRLPFGQKARQEYTMANCSFSSPTDIMFCTGCFMLFRTDILQKTGGFDERYFMYMEDADLSRRVGAYGRLVFYPMAYVVHLWERASSTKIKYLLIHICSMIKYFWKFKFK